MPTTLSVENAPEDLVDLLRRRAERHHRSLEGEVLVIIEEAVRSERAGAVDRVLALVRQLGLQTPDEAAAMIRADRDSR